MTLPQIEHGLRTIGASCDQTAHLLRQNHHSDVEQIRKVLDWSRVCAEAADVIASLQCFDRHPEPAGSC